MRIVADSGCDLPDNIKTEIKQGTAEQIEIVPITVQIDEQNFVDDRNLDMPSFLNEMGKSKKAIKTAAPSPMLYFERFKESGSVFVVTLSSKISASYQNAMIAKNQYLEEVGNKFIHIFDSFSASAGQTLIALKIKELINKKVPETEIVAKVTDYINTMNTYFVLEKYDNLVKNGRVSPYVAKIAGLFSIYPICGGIDGKIEMIDKARGAKRALDKLVTMIASKKVDFEDRTLAISHSSCLDKALEYKEKILSVVKFKDVIINETSGAISTYADRGGIVVSF